jgi:hypothetical protein
MIPSRHVEPNKLLPGRAVIPATRNRKAAVESGTRTAETQSRDISRVFFLVDVLSLAVIIQAFFIIGGYDRNTQVRSLTYTTGHIHAVTNRIADVCRVLMAAWTFSPNCVVFH